MEAKASWERKRPEKVRGGGGSVGMGSAEDPETGLLGRWGPGLGSGETLNKLERALGPGKVELASCEGVPTGARSILEGRKAVDEKRGSWGTRHPDPVAEGQGAEEAPGQASLGGGAGARGWALVSGARQIREGASCRRQAAWRGRGLRTRRRREGLLQGRGGGLPGEKRPKRKRSAEGQERGPERGGPPGVGLG